MSSSASCATSASTPSRRTFDTYPSTAKQFDLLRQLVDELQAIGLDDAAIDEFGYVVATIPPPRPRPTCRRSDFIAHVDTSPEMPGAGVKPIVHRDYDGRDLVLPDDPTAVLRFADNPALAEQIGHDIVTASGTTLLGADNKAGVAEIVTAAEYLVAHPEIPHGPIRIALHAGRGGRPRHRALRRRAIRRALRLHDGRRQRGRDRDRELLRRRDDVHLPRLQHPSRLRQGADGQRDQGRGRLHRPPARRRALAGDHRRATTASFTPTWCRRASSGPPCVCWSATSRPPG